MPTDNRGKKKKKKKSSSPSKKNDKANNQVVRAPPNRQTTIRATLNLHSVNQPTPFSSSFEEEIEVLRNVFPPNHDKYNRKYRELSQQEPVFACIKRQETKTYNRLVATLYDGELQPPDRYQDICQFVMMIFKKPHCAQKKDKSPPILENNERYHYSKLLVLL